MNKVKALKSDVESGTKRKRYVRRKRLTDVGTAVDPDQENVRVAIYVRVSKEEQIEGHSLDAQRNTCIEFAQKRGWQVRDVYEDSGFSAKDVQRPAFKKMMTDAGEDLFDIVLVYKLDRFSRNFGDTLSSFKHLDDNKVAFTSVMENFDFSSAQGRSFLNTMSTIVQQYLENPSAEIEKGKKEIINKGLHNDDPPFGYIKNKETKKIEIVPEEAEAVKMLFELAAAIKHASDDS